MSRQFHYRVGIYEKTPVTQGACVGSRECGALVVEEWLDIYSSDKSFFYPHPFDMC